jgi:lipoprotein-releasing system permease protein
MVEGKYDLLKSNPNGIIIGSGIAEKMNVEVGDNINLTSSRGVNRTFKLIGIFQNQQFCGRQNKIIH